MTRFPTRFLAILFLGAVPAAYAQPLTYEQISAGTGFVVNPNGNVVTNAHVVQGCQKINVYTSHGDQPAKLIASDAQHDLAVLNVQGLSGTPMAPLRWNIRDLKIGDTVSVIGFPGAEGINGRSSAKKSSITSLQGPTGEPVWIQLSSVAEHGNSGGPVLDSTGNVIGVISGMAKTYRVASNGRPETDPIAEADVAITLITLQDFLRKNNIAFYESASSNTGYADVAIEDRALKFIVPVRCVLREISK